MDKELAEQTARVVQQSSFVLDSFLFVLKEKLDEEEFREYCQKFSKVITAETTGHPLVQDENRNSLGHP